MSQKLWTLFWLMLFMIFAPKIRLVSSFSTKMWCSRVPGLTDLQRELCEELPDGFVALGKGHMLGESECLHQFKGHRWNCSQVWRKNAFGQMIVVGSREAAFTYAISSAGAVHTITEACAQGNISQCGCDSSLSAQTQQQQQQWKWGGCSVDIGFGMKFARRFLDAREIEGDSRSLMNLHNNHVGRKVVKSLLNTECKCHGVSGSCAMRTCWKTLPSFRRVGDVLMKKYNRARLVQPLHARQGLSLVLRRRTRMTDQHYHHSATLAVPKPKRMEFVYLQHSPNYCEKDHRLGSLGTDGRHCNRTAGSRLDGCDLLCCGRGYDTRQLERSWQCRCKFHWCCHVQCEICHERIEQNTCK